MSILVFIAKYQSLTWNFLPTSPNPGHLQLFPYIALPFWVTKNAFTRHPQPHVSSLKRWQGHSHVSFSFHNSIYVWFIFQPQFHFLLHFHLCWPIPSFSYPFLQNVTQVYPFEVWKQRHTLLSVWELNSAQVGAQWPTGRLWAKGYGHWPWHVSVTHAGTCGLKSKQLGYTVTHSSNTG